MLKTKIKENKKFLILFLAVLLVGIFLRTYHFHDWLRFSEDEARDAEIVGDMLSGRQPLPLLGPLAGTSLFKLGPAYYYIQAASALIFGNQPAKLAYPDLFFSILAIPLFYLLFKKYFSRNVSLAATAVFSVAFFIVKYSRFAWNPNSAPFFSILFLYSLLTLAEPATKKKYLWAILAGLALGIGVQLHTVYLLVFPLVFLIAAAYGLKKKLFNWKAIIVVIFAALVFNIPQIIYELKTGGANTRAFLGEVFARDEKGGGISEKIIPSAFCAFQSNSMISTYLTQDNRCNLLKRTIVMKNDPGAAPAEKNSFFAQLAFSIIFLIGGYALLIFYLRRETDPQKKNFLKLMLLVAVITVAALTPMIEGVYMRFLLPAVVTPFLIFALWAKFLSEKLKKYSTVVLVVLVVLFAWPNLYSVKKSFSAFAAVGKSEENKSESMTLGEEEFLTGFILRNSVGAQTAYIQGGYEDIFKFIEPARFFFLARPDLKVKLIVPSSEIEPAAVYFKVKMVGAEEKRLQMSQQTIEGRNVLDKATFARYAIYRLDGPLNIKNNVQLQKEVGADD